MFITLGCDKILENGHIDVDEGIFGVLDEKLIRIKSGNIIPASENTSCKCRRTPRCNIDCPSSVYGIVAGGKISYRNTNKRM